MFGEQESESPRPGSPWDSLLSTSPSPSLELEVKTRLRGTPKLIPEVEEGNVEYKLKLVDPTPERFMRLVTQLKWRLLEGGGQAYYELGVADSGQLVGLAPPELEQSLETLEAMAGEIGASVIIIKEIHIPAGGGITAVPHSALAGVSGGVDFSRVDGALRLPRRRPRLLDGSDDSTPEPEPDTVSETTESQDEAPTPDANIEIAAVFRPLPSLRRPLATPQLAGTQKGKGKALRPPTTQISNRRLKRDQRRERRERDHVPRNDEALPAITPPEMVAGPSLLVSPTPQASLPQTAAETPPPDVPSGPRLIIEALVVRKLTADESFLDLSGFSL